MRGEPGGAEPWPETTERRWPDPEGGPWDLVLMWVRRDGRPEVVGLQVKPASAEAAQPLTTSLLRDLRLGELAADERMKLAHEQPFPKEPAAVRAGMRPATARRLALAAEVYREAWAAGDNPRKAVSERMNVTLAAAANLIGRARAAGFLPPTSAGVPMG